MKMVLKRLEGLYDPSAWLLIVLGLLLFSTRVQFTPNGWVNLPVAFTILQTGGLMFSLFGMQLMASMTFWPDLSFRALLKDVHDGKTSAAILLAGLLVFNGLSILGFSIWLANALGVGALSGG